MRMHQQSRLLHICDPKSWSTKRFLLILLYVKKQPELREDFRNLLRAQLGVF